MTGNVELGVVAVLWLLENAQQEGAVLAALLGCSV